MTIAFCDRLIRLLSAAVEMMVGQDVSNLRPNYAFSIVREP